MTHISRQAWSGCQTPVMQMRGSLKYQDSTNNGCVDTNYMATVYTINTRLSLGRRLGLSDMRRDELCSQPGVLQVPSCKVSVPLLSPPNPEP